MSFKPLTFVYTPPDTILADVASTAAVSTSTGVETAATLSTAAALIDRMREDLALAQYLQTLIVAKSGSLGVQLDYDSDPSLAAALQRLYTTDTAPAGVTTSMYDNLLETELGTMRADMALDPASSSVVVSPQQKADLIATTQAVENALASTGDFSHQLPLLLRELKGDEIVFDNLIAGLLKYGVLSGSTYVAPDTPPDQVDGVKPLTKSDLDIDPQLASELNARLDTYEQYAAVMYNLSSGINEAYSEISNFANEYLTRPLSELVSIMSMIKTLKMLFMKPKLNELKGLIAMMVMPRIISEAGLFRMLMDRISQKLVAPMRQVLNSLGSLAGEVAHVGTDAAYLVAGGGKAGGGLTGVIGTSLTGKNTMPTASRMKALDELPKTVKLVSGYLSWGIQYVEGHANMLESSFLKALDRRLGTSGDRLELMKSLSTMDSMITIFKGLILQKQQGGSYSQNGVLGILTQSLQSNGVQVAVSAGTLTAAQPTLPIPQASATAALKRAGVTDLDPSAAKEVISV